MIVILMMLVNRILWKAHLGRYLAFSKVLTRNQEIFVLKKIELVSYGTGWFFSFQLPDPYTVQTAGREKSLCSIRFGR